MPDTSAVRYLVLADRAAPYLLARVRWPDIAQAITAGSPDWLEDPGLFDLPYDPGAVMVSFSQAASVAAGWGTQLSAGAAGGVPSFIRRMPANWSDLSHAERSAHGIGIVGRQRVSARRIRRRVRRLRSFQAKVAASSGAAASGAAASGAAASGAAASGAAHANGHAGALAGAGRGPVAGVHGPAASGGSQVAGVTSGRGSAAAERRRDVRVRVDGRAHIRWGHTTISAGLVDLSEGGVRCVLPQASPMLAMGAALEGPFLLEAEVSTSRICLDVAGRISWHRSFGAGMNFGVGFGQLDDGETEGVLRFLAACGTRGYR